MLRHRIVVEAGLDDLVAVVEGTDFVAIDTHELLKVLRVRDGIGAVREVDGACIIDLFDDADGDEARRLVAAVRDGGYVVHHDVAG
jgi:hypothetical protein